MRYVGRASRRRDRRRRSAGRDAAELVAVDYEMVPAVTRAEDRSAPGAVVVCEGVASNNSFTMRMGNADGPEPRKLRFGRIAIDIAEAVAVARGNPAILAVVLVSIIINMFAFSYSALIAPIGLDVYRVSPILVGALAAAEPLGAIAIGIPLSIGWIRLDGRRALLRGSLLFLTGLAAMALSPWYLLAFVLLLIGGLGTAAFSNMQTTLILTEAPPATRSRVMGIVTMCIGTGPVGVVMIGILSGQVGPPVAILIMAGLGICGLSLVWRRLIRVHPNRTAHGVMC